MYADRRAISFICICDIKLLLTSHIKLEISTIFLKVVDEQKYTEVIYYHKLKKRGYGKCRHAKFYGVNTKILCL